MSTDFRSTDADVTVALQAAIAADDCTVHARSTPYEISAPLILPPGRRIAVEAGTVFQWSGPTVSGATGLFTLANDTEIAVFDGQMFTVRSPSANPLLVVALGISVSNVKLTGLFGSNCNQVFFSVAGSYADVVTPEMATAGDTRPVNICQDIFVAGGGCTFDEPNVMLAGCYVGYTYRFQIAGCTWRNTYSGLQFWGGDAGFDPGQQGNDPNAARKCRTFTVEGCTTIDTSAGIWGSFGADFTILNSRCYRASDVGHDYEGSQNGRVIGCYAEDCPNGNYTSFGYSQNLLFEGCTSRQSNHAWPLFRVYNGSQLPFARAISWTGGHLECTDTTGLGSFDTDAGCSRSIEIDGAALVNVVIRLTANNLNQVTVRNNRLAFTYRPTAAFEAITVANAHQTGSARPLVVVQGNEVYSETVQPSGSFAIDVAGTDYNGVPVHWIKDNIVLMDLDSGPAPMRAQHVGGNPGLPSHFVFEGNLLNGQIQTTSAGAATLGVFKAINNYTETGDPVGLTAV